MLGKLINKSNNKLLLSKFVRASATATANLTKSSLTNGNSSTNTISSNYNQLQYGRQNQSARHNSTTTSKASSLMQQHQYTTSATMSPQNLKIVNRDPFVASSNPALITTNISNPLDTFARRHIGVSGDEIKAMLNYMGMKSIDELTTRAIPPIILYNHDLEFSNENLIGESAVLDEMRKIASENKVFKSFLGCGYYNCHTPPVILRNLIENPAWYTPYTPYQAEISQGRMQGLLIFQHMVSDLTGLQYCNASLLDEATAAAEAMHCVMSLQSKKLKTNRFFVSEDCHPQTISVVQTRAKPLGIELVIGNALTSDFASLGVAGVLVQNPSTDGTISDFEPLISELHSLGAMVIVATDLLALTLMKSPGDIGADIAIGSAQRFGVPLGFGGPHAAFFATSQENILRKMPGRIIGVSKDQDDTPALRLTLQAREQHIRREKATSNVCTAQALLANVAAMYSVYHGPEGLTAIADRIHHLTALLAHGLTQMGHRVHNSMFFDTLRISHKTLSAQLLMDAALANGMNIRILDEKCVSISLDETTTVNDVQALLNVFAESDLAPFSVDILSYEVQRGILGRSIFARKSGFLQHSVFHSCRSEHEMTRFLAYLAGKDLSLVTSMIPLGSCTMKLNAVVEMMPVTWPEFANIHPFVPYEQAKGYHSMFAFLRSALANITGFADVSLQPNAGSQGEYAGLYIILKYLESIGQKKRDVCLIPGSAHGTNPASAILAGLRVVTINNLPNGYIDLEDFKAKVEKHSENLACLMITYPSTYGIFEENIRGVCELMHANGAQVYLDGANMNAMVGLVRPGDLGADVCHLNLHKTFCIPHGGGGPGMGPIGVAEHLVPFLPNHHATIVGGSKGIGTISAAPYGSSSILPITYSYLRLMGPQGLKFASQIAILSANYMKTRLEEHYLIKFHSKDGLIAHEFIIDLRPFKETAAIDVEDVAKRLMDYNFHAPTMSWPVAGIMMIEPTESESKDELDRFCDAMISIRQEIREIEEGKLPKEENMLKQAPHTAASVMQQHWSFPYSRERAAFPLPWVKRNKFWPSVRRVNNVYGDRHVTMRMPDNIEL